MSTQPSLFDQPIIPERPPYAASSQTSREAAESIADDVGRLESIVLNCIASAGKFGHTCDEVEQRTGLSHQTASARCRGLVQKGRIELNGQKRETRSGRKAGVYVAVKP